MQKSYRVAILGPECPGSAANLLGMTKNARVRLGKQEEAERELEGQKICSHQTLRQRKIC